jgi:hypothetical protein
MARSTDGFTNFSGGGSFFSNRSIDGSWARAEPKAAAQARRIVIAMRMGLKPG